jgi:diguanylate cyclase (GGDEF)-like protein
MLDYFRIKILRYLGALAIIMMLSRLSLALLGYTNGSTTFAIVVFTALSIAIILSFTKVNRGITFSIVPISMLILHIALMQSIITSSSRFMINDLYLFPIYTFLLMGDKKGLYYSLTLYISVVLHFVLNDYNSSLFGPSGPDFLFVYPVVIFLLYSLHREHYFIFNKINKKSFIDELTGIANRSGILDEIDVRYSNNKDFFFILIDFDHFSHINANLGHALSDRIIIESAAILNNSDNCFVARWHGDQFASIFTGTEDELIKSLVHQENEIKQLANKLEVEVEITFSAGYSEVIDRSIADIDLVPYTEIALSEAKKGDGAVFHKFIPSNLEEKNRSLIISRDLSNALKNGDVKVHFQPKVSASTEKVTGMEALVRWIHPELGFIPPPEFIDVAEKTGEIVRLGEYVIEKSFEHLYRCQQLGFNEVTISVNVSPLHLLHTRFSIHLNETALKHKIDPMFVFLEITESVMLQEDMVILLQEIQRMGFSLSLDDFGTGYSSLSYLQKFSFNELKIDKSFTDGLLRGGTEITLFRTILSIAQSFGMKSVIEGVEEKAQLLLVREMGAGEIQGWIYSKALPTDDFCDYIKKMNL